MVGDALEVGRDLDRGHHEAEVARHRPRPDDQLDDPVVHFHLALVDEGIPAITASASALSRSTSARIARPSWRSTSPAMVSRSLLEFLEVVLQQPFRHVTPCANRRRAEPGSGSTASASDGSGPLRAAGDPRPVQRVAPRSSPEPAAVNCRSGCSPPAVKATRRRDLPGARSRAVRYTRSVRASIVLLAPAAIAACARADTARPAGAPAAQARRVVVLSLDGFGAERHRDNLRQGVYTDPDGVTTFAGGYVVERALPVNPTLTAPSHASIASGAFPAVTGIVANAFKLPGAPIVRETSGFEAPWGAETDLAGVPAPRQARRGAGVSPAATARRPRAPPTSA